MLCVGQEVVEDVLRRKQMPILIREKQKGQVQVLPYLSLQVPPVLNHLQTDSAETWTSTLTLQEASVTCARHALCEETWTSTLTLQEASHVHDTHYVNGRSHYQKLGSNISSNQATCYLENGGHPFKS
ncbi:uncharacterized protein LOC120200674 isoform X1 [Hibiscus syriacus]|uniref:uncharacterized protein LOC120200674 isoform X1 n=1 Tax=Hibiscus syriacus TaxID=106335 RepID=UPI0019215C30|nr:uncharacterized protein LOC120200674 isoform X1 [Hibiscus syriacus]XP_039057374.1 uncharacterized protein LOC120200674 isoform X1 [Hibiscus syriacus]